MRGSMVVHIVREIFNTLTIDSGSRGGIVQFIKFDKVVLLPQVARTQGLSNKLRKSSVKGLLSSFESCSDRSTCSGLLSTHTKTAGGTLSSGNTSALSRLGGTGSRGGPQGVDSEFEVVDIVDGTFLGFTALPVENFHAERSSGLWNR